VRTLEDDERVDVDTRRLPERIGTLLASMSPAWFCVTSRPSGWSRTNARRTSGRDSLKWVGRYIVVGRR